MTHASHTRMKVDDYERGTSAIGLGAVTRVGQLVYGIIVPTWFSLKALKSEETTDDTQWLTYWVIFGLMMLAERVLPWLVYVIPLYYELKVVFLAWLIHMRGAQQVYEKAVNPYFPMVQNFVEDPDFRREKINNVTNFFKNFTKGGDQGKQSEPQEGQDVKKEE